MATSALQSPRRDRPRGHRQLRKLERPGSIACLEIIGSYITQGSIHMSRILDMIGRLILPRANPTVRRREMGFWLLTIFITLVVCAAFVAVACYMSGNDYQ